AGRIDLPQRGEAAAPVPRYVPVRDRHQRRRLRHGRSAALGAPQRLEAARHLDPGRRRAQELHAAGGAAAGPDSLRTHHRVRHRRAVLRRPGRQRRALQLPCGRGPYLGQGFRRSGGSRFRLRAHGRHRRVSLAHSRADERCEDAAQAQAAPGSARGGARIPRPRRGKEPPRAAQDGGVSRYPDPARTGEHRPVTVTAVIADGSDLVSVALEQARAALGKARLVWIDSDSRGPARAGLALGAAPLPAGGGAPARGAAPPGARRVRSDPGRSASVLSRRPRSRGPYRGRDRRRARAALRNPRGAPVDGLESTERDHEGHGDDGLGIPVHLVHRRRVRNELRSDAGAALAVGLSRRSCGDGPHCRGPSLVVPPPRLAGIAGSAALLHLRRPAALGEERGLEIVDGVDADIPKPLVLQRHPLQLPEQRARIDRSLLLAPLDLAPDLRLHLVRVVREAGREVIGAVDGDQARLEQVADVEAVHLPPLGDVEVVAGQSVAHPHLPLGGTGEEAARAPVFVQAESRLRAAHQHVLVLAGQIGARLAQEALDGGRAVLLAAVEEEPVEEGLHPLLVAADVGVHLAAGLREVFLPRPHQLVDFTAEVLQEHVDLGLDHEPPSMICMKRRNRYRLSCGPGLSSGSYCTANILRSGAAMPSTVLSYRLMCVTWTLPSSDLWSTAKPWFCEVRSILSPMTSRTGWFAPRWPNFSLYVFPPIASARIWFPGQMPIT